MPIDLLFNQIDFLFPKIVIAFCPRLNEKLSLF